MDGPHRARARGRRARRAGPHQRRDRRRARGEPGDGAHAREPGDGEAARARPRAARRVRLPVGTDTTAGVARSVVARRMTAAGPGRRVIGMTITTPAFLVEGLTKRYGERAAVAELTVSVPRGVVAGFIGPNGAGKTTTMAMLLGLVRPTAGDRHRARRSRSAHPERYLGRVGALDRGSGAVARAHRHREPAGARPARRARRGAHPRAARAGRARRPRRRPVRPLLASA